MRIIKNSLASIIMLLAINLTGYAANGVKITSNTKNLNNGNVSVTNIYLTSDKVLVENKGGSDNGTFMFNAAKEEFSYIDHNKKQYYFFDKPALDELKTQVKTMVMMMKQFASPEQREKLDKMLNPNGTGGTEFKATGKTTKINKWSTKQYEGTADGNKITEMYIADFSTVKLSKNDFKAMQSLVTYFKVNLSEIVALLPAGGSFSQIGFDDSSPIFKEGIPVKTISFKNGTADNENLVKSVSKENLKDSIFEIPAGYTRQQLKMDGNFGR